MKSITRSSVGSKNCKNALNLLWLEITPKCNLNCVHCYAESSPYRPLSAGLSLPDWVRLIEEAASLNCQMIQFIGGEPTIHPDLPKLIAVARLANIPSIEVYTNGTCLISELKQCFLENQIDLAFSVYADLAEIHDQVTRVQGSQQKTLAAIKWAIANSVTTRVGVIDTGINSRCINATVQMLRSMGLTNVGIDRMRNIGNTQVSSDTGELLTELCGKCVPGKLCVTSAGDIYPCVFSRFYRIGSAHDGLVAALESTSLEDFGHSLQNIQRALTVPNLYEELDYCNPDQPSPCNPDERCGPDISCHPDAECQPRTCSPDKTGLKLGRHTSEFLHGNV